MIWFSSTHWYNTCSNHIEWFIMSKPMFGRFQQVKRSKISHIGHQQHLCYMFSYVSLREMKHLVQDAKFICKKCGRVAAKERNLCEPLSL